MIQIDMLFFEDDTVDLIEKILYGISKDFIDEIAESPPERSLPCFPAVLPG